MTATPATPRDPVTCRWIRAHEDTYLDGELDPSLGAEFDRHLAVCAACGDELRFRAGFRDQLRETLGRPACPAGLRQRIALALDEEDRRRGGLAGLFTLNTWGDPGWTRPLGVPGAATALLAAAGVGLFALAPTFESDPDAAPMDRARHASVGFLPDVIESAVQVHRSALPADVQSNRPEHLARFVEPRVRFSAPPVRLDGARPVGARLVTLNGRIVPAYYYRRIDGRQVTVLVLGERGADRERRPPRAISRRVGGLPVQVLEGPERTYVLTGDLPENELARIAAAARLP